MLGAVASRFTERQSAHPEDLLQVARYHTQDLEGLASAANRGGGPRDHG